MINNVQYSVLSSVLDSDLHQNLKYYAVEKVIVRKEYVHYAHYQKVILLLNTFSPIVNCTHEIFKTL